VRLPDGADRPFEVFLNGVPQNEGSDYRVEGRDLKFSEPIRKEGKLGFWRWLRMFIGIAGTYRQNDSVDVTFQRDGRRLIETSLPIEVLGDDADIVVSGARRRTTSYDPG
jgi:hypothetical protein